MAKQPYSDAASLALAGITLIALLAAPARAADDHGTFTVLNENDTYFSPSDRDYTNGLEFLWTTTPADTAGWAVRTAHMLPFFPVRAEVRTRYGLGQTMFTPEQLYAINPPKDQHPYAGFLFGEFDIIETNEREQNAFGVRLGIIGPASIAEDAQKFLHAAEGRTKPRGWNTQLRDEPGLVLTYENSMRFALKKSTLRDLFDIEPHFGGTIGNVYDYANAGGAVRLGFNMPDDYIPSQIEPAVPGAGFFRPVAAFGAYLFAGIDARAVARNIFLDGNSFQTSRHVDKKNFVSDIQYGAVMALDRYRLALTHTMRSREFRAQPASDEFTTITMSARF